MYLFRHAFILSGPVELHWEKSYGTYNKNIRFVSKLMKYDYLEVFPDFQPIHNE